MKGRPKEKKARSKIDWTANWLDQQEKHALGEDYPFPRKHPLENVIGNWTVERKQLPEKFGKAEIEKQVSMQSGRSKVERNPRSEEYGCHPKHNQRNKNEQEAIRTVADTIQSDHGQNQQEEKRGNCDNSAG